LLVRRIVEHCLEAGAKKVFVFDHTCNQWEACYKSSGIENAVKLAGGIIVPGNSKSYYHEVKIPGGELLKETMVHELILESNVFINVPILKHHGGGKITVCMKNLMGVVWDRKIYHRTDLHKSIAEFCLFRKPDLNIVDAYYVMKKHGPKGGSLEDVELVKNQIISTDILAADIAAAKIFGIAPDKVDYLSIGGQLNLGKSDLNQIKIKKIAL